MAIHKNIEPVLNALQSVAQSASPMQYTSIMTAFNRVTDFIYDQERERYAATKRAETAEREAKELRAQLAALQEQNAQSPATAKHLKRNAG